MSIFVVPIFVVNTLESLRARFFWGTDLDERCMDSIRWNRILAQKKEGVIGVGSLFSLNRALLYKWHWRFFHNPDLIWVKIVKVLYGPDGGCSSLSQRKGSIGPWNGVIRMLVQLNNRDLDLRPFSPIRIGDGNMTSFRHHVWKGDSPLVDSFHRIYALDPNKTMSVRDSASWMGL